MNQQNNADQAPQPQPVQSDTSGVDQSAQPQPSPTNIPEQQDPSGLPGNQNVPVDEQQPVSVDEYNNQIDMEQYAEDQVDSGDSPEVADAKVKRLMQMNSKKAKLLQALGVDPLSDIADQLEEGLITPEMVKSHIMGSQQPQQQAQPQQQVDPMQEVQQSFEQARQKYEEEAAQGEVALETLNEYMRTKDDLNDARLEQVTRQVTARTQQEQVDQNVNAVLNVARSNPEYSQMSPDLQQTMDAVNLSLTASIADQEARQMGLDPASLNAQQYAYFANKGTKQLSGLAEFYMNLGAQKVRQNQTPNRNNANTMPVPSPANSARVPQPQNKFATASVTNHEDMARQYMRNNGQI